MSGPLACDESGSEGDNLVGANTAVFAHAGVRLDPSSASACVAELRARIRSPAVEYKANHLLRAKNRAALVWFLGPSGPLVDRAGVLLVDKALFLTGKIVDLLVDRVPYPECLARRPDARAEALHHAGPRFAGERRWAEFLRSFTALLHTSPRRPGVTPTQFFSQDDVLSPLATFFTTPRDGMGPLADSPTVPAGTTGPLGRGSDVDVSTAGPAADPAATARGTTLAHVPELQDSTTGPLADSSTTQDGTTGPLAHVPELQDNTPGPLADSSTTQDGTTGPLAHRPEVPNSTAGPAADPTATQDGTTGPLAHVPELQDNTTGPLANRSTTQDGTTGPLAHRPEVPNSTAGPAADPTATQDGTTGPLAHVPELQDNTTGPLANRSTTQDGTTGPLTALSPTSGAPAAHPVPSSAAELLAQAYSHLTALRDRLRSDPALVPPLDPLMPALADTVGRWRATTVIHDEQPSLTRARVATLLGPTPVIHFVDSRTDPRVQIADFLAGTARRLAEHTLHQHGDPELMELLRAYVLPSSIWVEEGIAAKSFGQT
ncbi:hypothetical protein [Amycolatopsis sp. FDAARGOS 1241]|uniref:hypothetical protein n=1 Tax=Amycolatopsis sp. FDAARGOS 1241 TaxID=2778070 RepID=UPI00194E65F3|nr:hypothetical protein [Amycolatopsis sp. FDAARGOS 1241]QRP47655.1 hypothetical protein I6J71_06905 [Amycolatopsis sp. FDAARGOS 1241]